LIAVSFDPGARGDEAALAAALAPATATISRREAFAVAHAPPAHAATVGPLLCVLHGELLGRTELCRELGAEPGSKGADLVALAYRSFGLAGITRLRGTFAVALWDSERRRGVLASDHFAVHPWYVRRVGGAVLAATTMSALLRMLPTAPEPDGLKAITWLATNPPPGSVTFARGVERLAGGCAVLFEDGRVTTERWWQPVYREPLRESRTEMAERLRAALGRAVGSRIVPGERTGVILSGGFDSSAVTGVAASETAEPEELRTYSAAFPDDPDMDESSRVRDLVGARSLSNYLIGVEPAGLVRAALEYQRDFGVPLAGPGFLLERPLLERAALDGARAILDGQGGDELFGFDLYLIADRVRRGRLLGALSLLANMPDQAGLPSRNSLRYCVREYAVRPLLPAGLERRLRLRGDRARGMPAWLRRDQVDLFWAADTRMDWKHAADGPLWWRHHVNLMTKVRGGLTEYIGHRASDLGLAMRPPLLDVDLTELALRIPPGLAYGGINRSLARDSVAGEVPDSVRLAAKKSNLRPFYHRTLTGADLASIRLLLEPAEARIYRYADREAILALLARPPAVGDPNWTAWSLPIWVGLTAEIALRTLEDAQFPQAFIDRHNPPARSHSELR
jgi:asparagine synthase (glutamine-hydrolysing)